jgi:hypothetical protein
MLVCSSFSWIDFLGFGWNLESGVMDIQNFIEEFKKTFVYDILSQTLSDEQLFEHVVDGDAVLWFKEQTRQMWLMWEEAQAQAVPELTDKMIVAIESEVESQLKASAIDADPFRLDGEKIWYAALEAQEQAND